MDRVLARFADPAGGFFDTADDHERLVARPKDLQDNAVPSGNAVAALVLLRLAAWTGEGRYRDAAERALRTVVPFVDRYPTGFAQWLSAMDLALAPAVEVAIVGEPGDAATQALLGVVETGFRPHQVVAVERGSGRRASSRCLPTGSPSTADPPPMSVAASSAACPSPTSTHSASSSTPAVADPVESRPAATVVLMRPGRHGQEVLLGRRPASMSFAPDVHVFPGGRVDPTDAHPSLVARSVVSPEAAAAALGGDLPPTQAIAAYIAAIRESFEEAGVLLADVGPGLVAGRARGGARGPRRWRDRVPGAGRPTRPDAPDRLARADLALGDPAIDAAPVRCPVLRGRAARRREGVARRRRGRRARLAAPGRRARCDGGRRVRDVAADERDAPAARARRRTSTTSGRDWRRARSARSTSTSRPRAWSGSCMPAGGGVAGQPVNAYLVGRHSFVLVDPGDPTGPGLDRAIEEAAARGGTIRAIALTHVDPDHAAGAELLSMEFDAEVLVGPGGGRRLPYETRELADGDVDRCGRRRRCGC